METLKVKVAKQELSKVNFQKIIEIATMNFCNACYEQGLSVEEAQRIMTSKQGLDVIAKEASKLI